jgi:hypothetical protein
MLARDVARGAFSVWRRGQERLARCRAHCATAQQEAPEQNGWQFFNDPANPELSRTHRIDWWTANTDPSLVFFEPDIFHSYSGRARFPDPVDGSKWDAFGFWQENTHRLVGWHVKDGTRLAVQPAPPANLFTQTIVRRPTFAPGGSRATTLSTPVRERSGRVTRSTRIRPSSASRRSSTTSETRREVLDPRDGQRDRAGDRSGPLAPAREARDRVPARAPSGTELELVARGRGRDGTESDLELAG